LLFLISSVASASGCFSQNVCQGPGPCEAPCEDTCADVAGGLWVPVLVTSAAAPCPVVAPSEVTSSTTLSVTACSVLETEGACAEPEQRCVPVEDGWRVCVARDGLAHPCPGSYAEPVEAPGVTICCPSEA
jgi:hypothetical protein